MENDNDKLTDPGATRDAAGKRGTSHTPGPWTVDSDRAVVVPHPAFEDGMGAIATVHSWVGSATADANARLIAAAPDLLDALKVLCERYNTFAGGPFVHAAGHPWSNALTAIAKAEGR